MTERWGKKGKRKRKRRKMIVQDDGRVRMGEREEAGTE
jgi:hypothetical protein